MDRTGRPRADRIRTLGRLREVDPQQRSTIGSAAQSCFIPPTTLIRETHTGSLRVETSVAKPILTEDIKKKKIVM
ncbi:hypothetical protein PI124_g4308 [Phytophthora idaei]|nr:hypothetical protein PI125_g4150 [Phytophthora idaei]KAG3159474.1 hypothetical protein PI126_g7373 [Phytophthora idaei]KAG3251051.1 hypothetical protein PI124_g4308 [Phytophthora idaei]